MDRLRQMFFVSLLLAFLPVLPSAQAFAGSVGQVDYTQGVLTGKIEGQSPRILGRGETLRAGEILQTSQRGFALIRLEDGTRMTLRPNTVFRIDNVNTEKGKENAFMRLIRGGFRAITGFISKRRPGSFKVTTSVATIGIRGTEFDARLCEGNECAEENTRLAADQGASPGVESRVIGRVALLRGKASALDGADHSRPLSTGAAVYESDRLQTGIQSIAVIAFNDQSRVTMSPNTVFRIEQHRYRPDKPKESNAFLRFIRGGLRLVTGLIGKINRPSWRVGTPTATIGIRGTGFDLVCDGECVDQQAARFDPWRETVAGRLLGSLMKPAFAQQQSGMYARVWKGEIVLQNAAGSQVLTEGQTAFLRSEREAPRLLPELPPHLRGFGGAPRPDKVVIKHDLFARVDPGRIDPGLYVNVRKGDVQVRGKDGSLALLGAGEASMTGLDGKTQRLAFVPPFQQYDDTPMPGELTPRAWRRLELFGKRGGNRKTFQCRLR